MRIRTFYGERSRTILVIWLSVVALAAPAAAGTLTGIVRNGTTGAPVPNVEVVLLQLQGGMEAVATTKSDALGRYRLEHSSLGQAPMLLRVAYRGVNYHQNVPPGRDSADVEVFEVSQDPSVLQVASRLVVFQPYGPALLVGEEYSVHNHSKPPTAYYKAEGTFEFQLPEGGELAQVSAWGPSGMPLVQGTIEKGKRHYAIAFPLRPGENGIRLSYQLPYANNQATMRLVSLYAAQRMLVIAPPSVQVQSADFRPAGTEQGWSVYARDAIPANATIEITISGTAPPSSASDAGGAGQGTGPPAAAGSIQVLPPRLGSLKWILIAGFASLFVLGAFFLWRRPVRVATANRPTEPAAKAIAEVEKEVQHNLDEVKELLFRLELRKAAGTISDQEYVEQRARAEKMLRDFLR